MAERLVVAHVRGFRGLRGTLRLESLTDNAAERFAPGAVMFVEGTDDPLTVAESEADGEAWLVRLEELPDRNAAERLRGAYLEAAVERSGRQPGEYYWHEILGAVVRDLQGEVLGEVKDVYRAGGAEVLLVSGPAGEIDVPVVRPLVRVFEPGQRQVVVDAEALGLRTSGSGGSAGE